MSEEIRDAVQIIEVAYDGIEIAMKVGSGGISAMQKAVDFLKGMLDYEKNLGKTSMKKLLMRGGDLQVLEFATKDMKKVKRFAKKYGMLYSVLPDVNKKDGRTEIIFHTEAVPRANMLLQKIGGGRIATFDDYLKDIDEKKLDGILKFLKNQKKGNEMSPSPEKARAGILMDGLIEKVGMYAMEKKSINVEAVKENFSINHEQAENVIKQLETIGFLDKLQAAGVDSFKVEGRMKTAYTFCDGASDGEEAGGFLPTDTAKDIGMLVMPKRGASLVKKTERVRTFAPDQNQSADAYKFDYRTYYDLIVRNSAVKSVYTYLY